MLVMRCDVLVMMCDVLVMMELMSRKMMHQVHSPPGVSLIAFGVSFEAGCSNSPNWY